MEKTEYFCYVAGRISARIIIHYTGIQMGIKGVKLLRSVAKAHKIDSNDPAVVTENVFNCLKFID